MDEPDEKKRDKGPGPGESRNLFPWLLGAMVLLWLISSQWGAGPAKRISYAEFETFLEDGEILEVEIGPDTIQGKFVEADEKGVDRFVTVKVDDKLAAKLKDKGVNEYRGVAENTVLLEILSWVVPVALFVGVWLFFMRRLARNSPGSGLMSIGKSKAKVYVEDDTKTTFADVAGVEEAKEELVEVVEFLKDPASYGRLGARMPRGVLLVGPPGTGKTLLARAVAGEAGVPFFSISGSEFVEMFVGVGAARVRDLFEQARQKAPCIIFVDELDALGRARTSSAGLSGGHDEKEQTLNQLLVELDGFDDSSGIILLSATNRPEILDPALLRAGRFDRQVVVDRPDKSGRVAILEVHSKKIKLAPNAALEEIAALTPGFTGADLANLVNEAALVATRRDASTVELTDFTAAIERIVAGLERKNRLINPRERSIVAHHEMGHALVAAAVAHGEPVHKVSIIPRGVGALGYTLQRPLEDRFLMTKQELEERMTVLFGGRAAEELIYNHLSTGASDDLNRATDMARSMATRYGMVEALGHSVYDPGNQSFLGDSPLVGRAKNYSEETAREIDVAVRDILDQTFARAREILSSNRALLEESARELLKKEMLDGSELEQLLARVRWPEDAADRDGNAVPTNGAPTEQE